MPNKMYQYVHNSLSTMVSARVARRALKATLKNKGLTPNNVDLISMLDILKGPIFDEFQLILPRDGLKRNLTQLMSEIKSLEKKAAKEAVKAFKSAKRNREATNGDIFKDTLSEFQFEDPDDVNVFQLPEKQTLVSKPVEEKMNKPSPPPPPLDKKRLEEIVMQFAQIEHVKLVAAIRQKGEIVTSRGSGIDLKMFSRLGLMGLKLLSKGGQLCSYYLSHTCGQLFILILGQDIIIIKGTAELNFGAIFTNMSTLKEQK